jgi:hypothetical protein
MLENIQDTAKHTCPNWEIVVYLPGATLQNSYSIDPCDFYETWEFQASKQIISLLQDSAIEHNNEKCHTSFQWMSLGKPSMMWQLQEEILTFLDMKDLDLIFQQLKN